MEVKISLFGNDAICPEDICSQCWEYLESQIFFEYSSLHLNVEQSILIYIAAPWRNKP